MAEPEGTHENSHEGGARGDATPVQESVAGAKRVRRHRYRGLHPRRFEEKYKEHRPDLYPETVEKVISSGKTPAGTHRSIMVQEVIAALALKPGMVGVDCTLGYGGHAQAILSAILPGGKLVGLDADQAELEKTEARLRSQGFSPVEFVAVHSNFAGLSKALAGIGLIDFVLADLGVSSMQLDDPTRGFSYKESGPLDMRMNRRKSPTAADLLRSIGADDLMRMLRDNADEPQAEMLARALAGREFSTTISLSRGIDQVFQRSSSSTQREDTKRRVFQALRIAVNGEFEALEALLRALPWCLRPCGRAVFLTFHSGEDRRVKQAFKEGLRDGTYSEIAAEVQRAGPDEVRANPRSKPAKLRWAVRAGTSGGVL